MHILHVCLQLESAEHGGHLHPLHLRYPKHHQGDVLADQNTYTQSQCWDICGMWNILSYEMNQ